MNARPLRTIAWGAVGALVVLGGGVLLRSPKQAEVPLVVTGSAPSPPTLSAPPVRRWLDGAVLPGEVTAQPAAIAIVVDNAPEANPQSGLADAPLVFEVPVEGGRTRFLAIFPAHAPSARAVGPVRSLRPYFTAIARALRVPIAHVGGSPEALANARASRWPHVDQYFDPPFHRVTFRRAPFNVYTTLETLASFAAGRWKPERHGTPIPLWTYADVATAPSQGATDAGEVPFGGPVVVAWRYEPSRKAYVRFQDGREHRDANGKPVIVENIVVLAVRTRVLDAVGRLDIPILEHPCDLAAGDTLVSRRAVVRTNGERREGTWTWPGVTTCREEQGMIAFRSNDDATMEPLTLRPGRTWVEFVPGTVN